MKNRPFFYKEKWSKSKISSLYEMVSSMLVESKQHFYIWQTDGHCVCHATNDDFRSLTDKKILSKWVGGQFIVNDILVLKSKRENECYYLEIENSKRVPHWSTITHFMDGSEQFCEFYDTYEDTINAIEKIKKGKQPYKIIARWYV